MRCIEMLGPFDDCISTEPVGGIVIEAEGLQYWTSPYLRNIDVKHRRRSLELMHRVREYDRRKNILGDADVVGVAVAVPRVPSSA